MVKMSKQVLTFDENKIVHKSDINMEAYLAYQAKCSQRLSQLRAADMPTPMQEWARFVQNNQNISQNMLKMTDINVISQYDENIANMLLEDVNLYVNNPTISLKVAAYTTANKGKTQVLLAWSRLLAVKNLIQHATTQIAYFKEKDVLDSCINPQQYSGEPSNNVYRVLGENKNLKLILIDDIGLSFKSQQATTMAWSTFLTQIHDRGISLGLAFSSGPNSNISEKTITELCDANHISFAPKIIITKGQNLLDGRF